MEIFELTLKAMPKAFSSTEFCKKLRKNKCEERLISNGYALEFLKQKCQRGPTRRTWYKDITTPSIKFPAERDWTEDSAVNFLKKTGRYEIFMIERVQL
jgi:hypothetical protein